MTLLPIDVVRLSGKGANEYLQGQVTADVNLLTEQGGSLDAFVLEPTGKVHSLVTIVRSEDTLNLLVDKGYGQTLLSRLKRFAIRAKTEFSLESDVEVFTSDGEMIMGGEPLVYVASRLLPTPFSIGTFDIDRSSTAKVDLSANLEYLGLLRSKQIAPLMRDLENVSVFPATFSDIFADLVSLSKGCYTGQELVARMDSRGSIAPLVFATFISRERLDQSINSDNLMVEGSDAGNVTSFYFDTGSNHIIATGYIKRRFVDSYSLEFVGVSTGATFERIKPPSAVPL